MNYIVLIIAALQIGAAQYSFMYTDWRFGVMWLGIATANVMLYMIEGN